MVSDINADTSAVRSPQQVLQTWFLDDSSKRMDLPQPKRWFMGGAQLDQKLKSEFSPTLTLAGENRLDHWLDSTEGTLALIILLDQFNRNINRGTAAAFQYDAKALDVSKHALAAGIPEQLPVSQRMFCFMPFEHDESIESQHRSVALFQKLKEDAPADFSEFADRALASAIEHKDIIEQFGRYPHRNTVLDRSSTEAELDWILQKGKSFGQ